MFMHVSMCTEMAKFVQQYFKLKKKRNYNFFQVTKLMYTSFIL